MSNHFRRLVADRVIVSLSTGVWLPRRESLIPFHGGFGCSNAVPRLLTGFTVRYASLDVGAKFRAGKSIVGVAGYVLAFFEASLLGSLCIKSPLHLLRVWFPGSGIFSVALKSLRIKYDTEILHRLINWTERGFLRSWE